MNISGIIMIIAFILLCVFSVISGLWNSRKEYKNGNLTKKERFQFIFIWFFFIFGIGGFFYILADIMIVCMR